MLRTTTLLTLMLMLLPLAGCGKDQPAGGTNSAGAGNSNAGSTDAGATSGGTGTGSAASGANTGAAANNNGHAGSGTSTVLDASLVKHAAGLSILQPDSFAVLKLDMASARQAPLVQSLEGQNEFLREQLSRNAGAMGADEIANVLEGVEVAWAAVGPPATDIPEAPVSFTAYARFKDAAALAKFLENSPLAHQPKGTFNNVEYSRPEKPGAGPYAVVKGAEIYVAMTEPAIQKIISAQGHAVDSVLVPKLKGVNFDQHFVLAGSLGPLREMAAARARQATADVPLPHAKMAADLVGKLDWATIAANLAGEKLIDIQIDLADATAAEQLQTILDGLIAMARLSLQQEAKKAPDQPGVKEVFGLMDKGLGAIKVERNEKHVAASLAYVEELDQLPAIVLAAREAAQKVSYANNAKQIVLAALNHQTVQGKRPKDIVGSDGKPLLSWRVAILPFVEQMTLHDAIQHDQPWDSEQNREFTKTPVATYFSPGVPQSEMTSWKMLPDAPGGILFIDAGPEKAVPWAMPEDFEIDPADPLASLGSPSSPQGYIVAYTDGRVLTLSPDALIAALAGGAPPDETPTEEPPPADPSVEPEPSEVGETAPQPRTWKDATGKFSVEAVLGEVKGNSVTLIRTDNGKAVTIPINRLSKEDQQFLKSLK